MTSGPGASGSQGSIRTTGDPRANGLNIVSHLDRDYLDTNLGGGLALEKRRSRSGIYEMGSSAFALTAKKCDSRIDPSNTEGSRFCALGAK